MAWTPPSDAVEAQEGIGSQEVAGWTPPSDAVEQRTASVSGWTPPADSVEAQQATPKQKMPPIAGPSAGLIDLINKKPAPKPEELSAGFMLRPEFVEEVRNSFAELPPEKRRAALEQEASGSGVRAQAAQRILADVRAQDQRQREVNLGREKMVELLANAPKKPVFGIGTAAGKTQFPDVTPTFLEQMEQVPEKERIQKRLALDEASRAVTAAATSPEAIRERDEMERSLFDQVELSLMKVGVPQAQAGGMAMNLVAQQGQIDKANAKLAELESYGLGDSEEAAGLRKTIDFYNQRQQTYMKDLAQKQQELSVAPTYRGVRQLSESKTFKEGLDVFASDPVAIVANLAAQSLPTSVAGLVLGTINPVLGAAAMGGSSLGVEFGSSLMEFAQDKGFDTRDPEQMAAFFADKELLREGINKAGKRAGIVAAGDMFLAGLASKTMVPKRITSPVAKNVANMVAQMGAQGIGGGGFEAAAQIVTEGAITKPGEVLAEALGELGGAPAEVYTQTREAARDIDRQRAMDRLQAFREQQTKASVLSDEDRQLLVDHAKDRLAELTRRAEGTEEQIITTPDGKRVKIPAQPKQFLSPEDKDELAFLQKHSDNPEMLGRLYEISRPEQEAPPAEKAPPSTESLEQKLKELERLAGIEQKEEKKTIQYEGQEYNDTPRIRALIERAGDITSGLPPVPEGMTRLWRGNRPDQVGKARAFTNSLVGIALPFQESYRGPLTYIDVPTEELGNYESHGAVAPGAEFYVTEDMASKAKVVKQPKIEIAAPEQTPVGAEDLAAEMKGMTAPREQEVQDEIDKLTADQEAALAAREEMSKRTAGTSLIKVLKGTLNDGELSELGGRARQVGKNPFLNLKASKGQRGSSMEDMVDSGKLDLFLPDDMRPGHPNYENSESAEYIREKLRNNEFYTYEMERAIARVDEDIESIERQIQKLLSEDEINKEIQRATDEQRELDQATEEPAAEEATGAAEQGEVLERPTEQDVLRQEENKAKAAELEEREQIRKESEAGAGQFELTQEEGRQDTTGNLFEQKEKQPENVAISPEQERKEALAKFESSLSVAITPFRAVSARKTQLLKPAPLTSQQKREIIKLASDALDLGLPASVLGNVTAAGSTRMNVTAVMAADGGLMIAKNWKLATMAEKLHVLIHELAHSIDTEGGKPSSSAKWDKAHTELQSWYANSANKAKHPLAYPFAPQYKGRVRIKEESFAQALASYFTSPVDLQTNAPEAYSQIQSIIEGIQNESSTARAAGKTKTGTAGVKVQPSRAEKGAAVQPESGKVSAGVGATEELSNRGAEEVASKQGKQDFLSISPSVSRESEKRLPSITRKAKALKRQYQEGDISEAEYVLNLNGVIDEAERAKLNKELPTRQRGADIIRERILAAKRRGEISEKAADLAEWFILKNPALVEDLGISIRSPKEGEEGVAGRYLDLPRIIQLMKDAAKDDTVVHEILHHLERMMPSDIRAAIRKEWAKQLADAKKNAKTENEKKFFDLLFNFHYGDGKQKDFLEAVGLIKDGKVGYENYQYVNPSEFWAVNGSDIVMGRFDSMRGGRLQRLKNWLKELGQKMKSLFGLQSSAPIIRALDSLAKADGKFVTNKMLAEEAPGFASIKGEEEQPTAKKGVEDTWLLGRDKLGNVGFGPGAKAYSTIANITNKVLDKFWLKPISPELGRAMRNMKARVDLVQNKVAEVASEMSKLSPEEREMISDIIEGELKADIHPPQHILNLAAAIQSMMSRQSQELVDLGMLSKEAANRWDNKYLPRFYENKLRDEVNAWAKAAKAVFMKQPVMRGIRGSNLRSRGMFETINTDELQDYIDRGWEQRDPDFDPKTSTETVVWRDYTREERESMGEIRDAMFRFVMGYNGSQRDIALGRLYRDLAKNYASKVPAEGYVRVPQGNAEGTGAPRYGDLEGLYVPKEIMDHLSANDHAMAEGVLKIYRAGLSKWKEGKTVLNPVSHANNVISNVTMAHFAGVSYWDAEKYAGAIKDLIKNDEMVKEANEVGLFGGTFNQTELIKSMPPELRAMANMTQSKLANFGERIWDLLAYTVEVGGKKYGARPVLQWAYENEDTFFRYVIYRDARNRGMDPESARDYSQEFIFTYDDLPKGARALRDFAIPFFSYGYKVVPVLARTALVYPWRYAAPATVAYTANAMMYAMAASLGGDPDDWWGKVLYKYVTDEEFRKKANQIEAEERRHLPEWLKGHSGIMSTPKAIRMGIDDATGLPMFLDISRIFPGGDLLDANNNAGGVAMFQPLMPTSPVINTIVAMLANKDMFLGKDVTAKTDTDAEKAQKRAAWIWKQMAPAIAVGNYHFDRAMNTVAQMTGKPITVDAGPLGIVSYTGIGKDGLPIQPKHAMLQTMGIKIRPYDLEISKGFEETAKRQLIREIDFAISRINRQESKGTISTEAAEAEREKLIEKKVNVSKGLTLEGKEKE